MSTLTLLIVLHGVCCVRGLASPWTQEQLHDFAARAISGSSIQQAYVKASNATAYNYFGYSVTISGDGNTLAVGALGESTSASFSGAVYIFVRAGTAWSQQAYDKPFDSSNSMISYCFCYNFQIHQSIHSWYR
jgi:hypothetical protein